MYLRIARLFHDSRLSEGDKNFMCLLIKLVNGDYLRRVIMRCIARFMTLI